ncbi:hypothetical protein NHX12_000672 [Muraenolepis orangiensis]|uniref:DNA-3-methyladenine glycosylase II n=1 Tax=Muraenolepis orangiensis TaxID=630683 RepID=A0A9Q0E051_9TELE|nr:hypothetical protein NHX12_000672 [Muraenolepis orangiensis]
MRGLRAARRKAQARPLKDRELCNGPSKLCQALDIPRTFDRRDLAADPQVWLEVATGDDPGSTGPRVKRQEEEVVEEEVAVVAAARVGIESHGEWAKKPFRFYLLGNPCVSVGNREAERRTLEVTGGHSE